MVDAGLGNPERTSTESLDDPPQDNEHHQPPEPLQEEIHGVPSEPEPEPEPDWVVSIRYEYELERQKFEERPYSGEKRSIIINRVPHSLRDPAHIKCYIPRVVSLGPYHHDRSSLKGMEQHKWRALRNILKRHQQDIKIYLDAMNGLEEKARTCYEWPVPELSSKDYVKMMVLDGCFVLELFRALSGIVVEDCNADEEWIKSIGYSTIFSIRRDMIMIENQIPLFVLEKLLSLQTGKKESDKCDQESVAQMALEFFTGLTPADPQSDESSLRCLDIFRRILPKEFQPVPLTDPTPMEDESGLHCLDILRRSLVSMTGSFQQVDLSDQQLIHCVIDLKNAGIKFKKSKTDRFWDIKFDKRNGVLKIPRIKVSDDTIALFFNLIAFEQCHMDNMDPIITSYAIFMDNLINSAEDVSHLHYCGIIEHWLGSEAEVADSFNKLCRGVVSHSYIGHLSEVYKDVNTYFKYKPNAWKADLRNKYFKNPWAIISMVAAIILLLLTFAQSFYAVYAYYRPPNS